MATEALTIFAYDDDKQSIVVEQRFSEAQGLMRQGLTSMIEAGGKFAEIRDLLRHNKSGGFDGWIESKQLGRRTVYRLLDLHGTFATVPHVAQLDIAATAAYLLAAPSTPAEARAEAIQRAEAGERITVATAKQIVDRGFANSATLVDPVRNFALTAAHGEIVVARAVLKQIAERSPHHLTLASDSDALAPFKPFRLADLAVAAQQARAGLPLPPPSVTTFAPGELAAGQPNNGNGRAKCTICGRPISDPASIARGAGDVCAGHPAATPAGVPTPTGARPALAAELFTPLAPEPAAPAFDLVELADVVDAWLDDKVEALDLADGNDARRYALNAILASRNGSHNEAWRNLRAYKGWPADVSSEDKLAGVRAALRRLNGDDIAPPPASSLMRNEPLPATHYELPSQAPTFQPPAGGGLVFNKIALGLEQLIDELIACAAHLETLGCDANEHLANALEQAQDLLTLTKGELA